MAKQEQKNVKTVKIITACNAELCFMQQKIEKILQNFALVDALLLLIQKFQKKQETIVH